MAVPVGGVDHFGDSLVEVQLLLVAFLELVALGLVHFVKGGGRVVERVR